MINLRQQLFLNQSDMKLKTLFAVSALGLCVSAYAADTKPFRSTREHARAEAADWKPLGTGTLVDGWVTPGLMYPAGDLDPKNYPFEVEIYESVSTPCVYRLISPWTSDKFPFREKNANNEPCDIIIDATNPDFVKIEPQASGFLHADPNHSKNYTDPFMIGNMGVYYLNDGNSEEDIIAYGFASTMADGVITVVKPCFGKSGSNSDFGYSWPNMPDVQSVITLPHKETAKWVERGELTFVDGFIYPGFKGDPARAGWKVPFEELEGSDGVYRIVNPYLARECPLLGFNTNTSSAWVVIDASDPGIVLITPQYSGFSSVVDGSDFDFYIGNDAGNLYANELWSVSDIKQYLPGRLDKMVDGVITVREPLFGSNSTAGFGMQWVDKNDKPLSYAAKFVFPWAAVEPGPDSGRERTFYESFEDYREDYGMSWIPEGWSQVNTEENTPTAEMLSHNVNNTWYGCMSSSMFQEFTPDGEKEMFIHFAYDGDWCSPDAQDEWLVTPLMRLEQNEELHFLLQADFFSVYDWVNDYDFSAGIYRERNVVNTLKVMVTTDGGDVWDEVWDLEKDVVSHLSDAECYDASDLRYRPYDVDLSAYAGKDVKIAFRYVRTGQRAGNSMILDRVVVDHPESSGVAAVAQECSSTPVVYYDMNGFEVDFDSASPGIFIEKSGETVRKIVKH